ncbi:DUF917 domain-containing protein [Aquamicrobium sp. LC103]|uniref:DUF917 domain-containing protein n=1 Tax=Aquamicrobium sp. LC103 TaxID=1120658 RepID=UPI0010C9B5AC|nr:DUF917 domain-containing protein [Aquamicrobium sp. LC103]TKT78248.1 DUF917 domain-containing protein [Aquamicrobium sp. LC103]
MSAKGYTLTERDLVPLSIGAAFLGTGGGGNPYLGMLRTREVLRKGGNARILPLDALPDEAWIGAVGGIGAPVVGFEKLAEGGECYRAMRAIEDATGKKMSALIPVEIGGANAMAPIIAAAMAGLPVIDGDGMGRAFPEGQMTTFSIYGGRKEGPSALADDKGNVVVVQHTVDAVWRERLMRNITVSMGAGAGAAGSPMSMEFVRRAAIPSTITQAIDIGQTVLDARAKRQNVVERVVEATGGTLFFAGKITDIQRELTGGFSRGHAVIAGVDQWMGSEGRIAIQNENLVLWIDGTAVVTVPDLIINVELDTGEPLTTEVLPYGQRIAVIGLPAHELLKTPEALKVVGPKAFGYPELSFSPLAFTHEAAA